MSQMGGTELEKVQWSVTPNQKAVKRLTVFCAL